MYINTGAFDGSVLNNSYHEFVIIDEGNKMADVFENEVKLDVKNITQDKTSLNFLFR